MTLTAKEAEALAKDYPKSRVQRSEAERFPLVQRGSVRFTLGLYRTEDEQDAWIDRGAAIRLPGQESSSLAARLGAKLRGILHCR